MPIRFFYEETNYKIPFPRKTVHWITEVIRLEKRRISSVNYIFCSDRYLLKLNREFLNHDTLTDIITFDESAGKLISGEIYISVERIKENSVKFGSSFNDELHRVMIHGILHSIGYRDKKPKEISVMRKKEEAYLSLWETMFHVKQQSIKLNTVPRGTI
jgi:probable rRNA maturation factor